MRSITLLLSILTLGVAPVRASPTDDVSSALERLGDSRAEARLDAQRWLGIHLARTDFADVAAAARSGSAETRRRLALALASEDRHLGLAVLLLTDRDDAVRAVGEAGVAEMLARWSSSSRDLPRRARSIPEPWDERYPTPIALGASSASLVTLVDRLARLAPGPASIVLDPSLAVARRRPVRPGRPPVLEGTWAALLKDLARDHRVSFEVFGMREAGEVEANRAVPWVRVCKRGDEGDATTNAHVIDWCRGLAREHDEAWNTACAQALAALDWPAAVLLLEERWTIDGQDAALEGLLSAAARGRVSPVLSRTDTLRRLLARPLEGADGAGAAERLGRALARVSPFEPDGDSLTPTLVLGWERAGKRSRWVRLVAIEGMGVRSPEAARRAREVLADPAAAPELRRQAARALARTRGTGEQVQLPVRGLRGLFVPTSTIATLAADLSAAGALPPGADARAWKTLPALFEREDARLAFIEWCLGAGTPDGEASAAACLRELLDTPGADLGRIAARLRFWAAGTLRGPAKTLVGGLRAGQPAEQRVLLGEVAFRAGLMDAAERRAFLDTQLQSRARAPFDPAVLRRIACAAADPGLGAGARDVLLAALADGAPPEVLLPAIELASAVLRRARRDDERAGFLAALRREASRGRHPIAERFFARDWPPEPAPRPLQLELIDRSLRPE